MRYSQNEIVHYWIGKNIFIRLECHTTKESTESQFNMLCIDLSRQVTYDK